jgi:hypothetical protein
VIDHAPPPLQTPLLSGSRIWGEVIGEEGGGDVQVRVYGLSGSRSLSVIKDVKRGRVTGARCDITTSEMRGLSLKIISGDSQ